MPDWPALLAFDAPVLETVLRGTVVFVAIFLLMRLTGQREAGGLGISDVLLVVLVAEAAAGGLGRSSESLADAILLIATIIAWSVAVDAVAYRFPRLAGLLKARPRALVEDGRPNRRLMRRELMTHEELMAQLRLHGVTDLDEVRWAYLEPNGMVSVIRRDGGEPDGPERPEMP
ncbi:DUF421 domain-containing protein [Miltoncostaea marina]|uniref:DUF421 domain-containing protein n=1 Tax=Miltoncostaea marina TaxID=2843215 RepID=UPI001C3E47E6|nr:YetF domain-containing protein [Miltoncostaea marina]